MDDKLGEEYAQRLRMRGRNQANSPDFYLKNVQRRINIIEAIENAPDAKKENNKNLDNTSNGLQNNYRQCLNSGTQSHIRKIDNLPWKLKCHSSKKEEKMVSKDKKLEIRYQPSFSIDSEFQSESSSHRSISIDIDCETTSFDYTTETADPQINDSTDSSVQLTLIKPQSNANRKKSSTSDESFDDFNSSLDRQSYGFYRNQFGRRHVRKFNNSVRHNDPTKIYKLNEDFVFTKFDETKEIFGAKVLEIVEPSIVDDKTPAKPKTAPSGRSIFDEFKSFDDSSLPLEIKKLEADMENLKFLPTAPNQSPNKGSTTKDATQYMSVAEDVTNVTYSNKFEETENHYESLKPRVDSDTMAAQFESAIENFKPTKSDLDSIFETCSVENFATPRLYPNLSNVVTKENDKRRLTALGLFRKGTNSFLENLQVWKRRPSDLESTRNHRTNSTAIYSQIDSNLTVPYSPISDKQKVTSQEVSLPSAVEKFLENALGDEMYSTSVTYGGRDRTDSNFNATDLMSFDNKTTKQLGTTRRYSKTLNRTMTIYKSMTQRIKKKFRKSILDEQTRAHDDLLLTEINPGLQDSVKALLEQVEVQQTLVYQASKALNLCNSMKEFSCGPERVESERLLLMSVLRKKAYIEEIRRLVSFDTNEVKYYERAQILITDISLALREGEIRLDRQNGEIVEWFIVIISQGTIVWATQAVPCPIATSRLYFPGSMEIPGLKPDFIINVDVYSMKLQQSSFPHDYKYHISRSQDQSSCPTAKMLLGGNSRSMTSNSLKFSGVQDTAFIKCGSVQLMRHDLRSKSPWKLNLVPHKAIIQGTIDMNATCRLNLSVTHQGFLTHGQEVGGFASWNRRWCALEKHKMFFWNYPEESEYKEPFFVIDLMYCVSKRITIADRTICAKPKTLVIETARSRRPNDRDSIVVECRPTCTVIKHLLAFDTSEDLMDWQSKITHVISALREWDAVERKPEPEVSDL